MYADIPINFIFYMNINSKHWNIVLFKDSICVQFGNLLKVVKIKWTELKFPVLNFKIMIKNIVLFNLEYTDIFDSELKPQTKSFLLKRTVCDAC